jgi:hypothetical protein
MRERCPRNEDKSFETRKLKDGRKPTVERDSRKLCGMDSTQPHFGTLLDFNGRISELSKHLSKITKTFAAIAPCGTRLEVVV